MVGNLWVLLAWAWGGFATLLVSRVLLYAVWVVGLYAMVRRQVPTLIAALLVIPAIVNPVVIARYSEIGAYPTHLAAIVLACWGMGAGRNTTITDRWVFVWLGLASLDMPHALTLLVGYTTGRLWQAGWPTPTRWIAGGWFRREPIQAVALARSTVILCAAMTPVSAVGLTHHATRGGPPGTEALWVAAGMVVAAAVTWPLVKDVAWRPRLMALYVGVAAGGVLALGRPEAPRQLMFLVPLALPLAASALSRLTSFPAVVVVATSVLGFAGFPYALKTVKAPWWETLAFGSAAAVLAVASLWVAGAWRRRLRVPLMVFALCSWSVACSFRAVNNILSAMDEHRAYLEVQEVLGGPGQLPAPLPVFTPRYLWYPAVCATDPDLLPSGMFVLRRRSIEEMSSVFRQVPDPCTLEPPLLYLQLAMDPPPECFTCEDVHHTDDRGRHPHVLMVCR